VNLILENPLNRITNSAGFNLISAIPRTLLYTLSDEINLDVIQFYNPRAVEFSDDGKNIPTNYGYRIRHFDGHDQLQLVIDQLKKDPATRRAVIHIHAAGDHIRRYTPCINSLHFLIRNNALECQAFWRSENAFTLLPYNLFEFTMLQELIASELQIPVGCFVQTVTSLHYYLDDQEKIEEALEKLEQSLPPKPMVAMPFHSLEQITHIREFERSLRLNFEAPLVRNELENYWQNIIDVLSFYVLEKTEQLEKAIPIIHLKEKIL
jgi:thymidylate synthase